MKKFMTFLVVIALILAAGCSSPSVPVEDIEGFDKYTNDEHGFSLQYPEDWILLDGSLSEEELTAALEEVFEDDARQVLEDLGADLSSAVAYWYDFDTATEDFVPNVNLTVAAAAGMTQNNLKNAATLKEMQGMLEDAYESIFSDFTVVENMNSKKLGNNDFAVFKFKVDVYGINAGFCQAMIVNGGDIYTFTLTTFSDKLSSAVSRFEQMLSSVAF